MPIHKLPDCTDWLTNIHASESLVFLLRSLYHISGGASTQLWEGSSNTIMHK